MSEAAPVWRNRVRAEREARGLSQAECARRVGMDRRNLWNVEMQRTQPDVSTLLRLAQAFGCTVDVLIEVEGSEQ